MRYVTIRYIVAPKNQQPDASKAALIVTALTGAGVTIVHCCSALLLPAAALAQTPDPAPVEGQHGAAYVSYGYTEGSDVSLDNLQFDVDLAVPGTVLSFTGHFTDGAGVHVGPTGGYSIGPINIFGRHLFLVGADAAAAAAIGNKTGGGIEVPLPKGAVLRLGIHGHQHGDKTVDELTIGVGARF